MRGWCGSLLLALLVILYLQSCVEGQNANGPGQCCFNFRKKPIPVRRIVKYAVTRPDCPKPGVILTNRRGDSVCVDPGDKWVKQAMDQIDQRDVANVPESPPSSIP
ncbi:C-C motif chemokine 18-like [Salminus brasiliensis]|uniref:C-C motif chemokine 18-like n=1 Tax=Salminus brasiliensis TaxID=930266 RepID=UPI003B83963C